MPNKELTKTQIQKLNSIERRLKALNKEINDMGFSVYLTNDTVNIMCGPSHDERARPLKDNSIRSFILSGWDGGDW